MYMPTEKLRPQRAIMNWTGWIAIILVLATWGFPVFTAMAEEKGSRVSLKGITVSGPSTVNERSSADYTATANYSNGSSKNVTTSATWTESSRYASINSSGHLVTTSLSANQTLRVSVAFNGKFANLNVTIINGTTSQTAYTISASSGANGTIGPSGRISVSQGASQVFTIKANTGYKVQGIVVDGLSVGAVNSYTFSDVTANHTISATFTSNTAPNTAINTISASPGGNGAISPSGSVAVAQGANQPFTIKANTGYKVQDVLVDGASVGAVTSYTFSNVTAAHTISATFAAGSTTNNTITASAETNGTISPSGGVSVSQGANQTFTIKANTGYKVQDVLVDGASVGAVNSYTFSNVTAAHTISATFAANTTPNTTPLSGTFQTFAVNDLGMHCYDPDFSVFSILPVYNVVHAQVIQQGSTPKIMDATVDVKYNAMADATGSINTTSAGKTNFWTYVATLFGTNPPVDEGLMGAKMPGKSNLHQPFSWEGGAMNWFSASGIPITAFDDKGKINTYPLMNVQAMDPANAKVLSSLPAVVPISNEMACNVCHDTGNVGASLQGINWSQSLDPAIQFRENILLLHDYRNNTNLSSSQPVLCASCHYSPVLDLGHAGPTATQAANKTLSQSVHGYHASRTTTPPPSGNACYYCHPGETTKCNRGAMSTAGLVCTDCHGSMTAVGQATRKPWTDLPKCQSCHTGDAVNHMGTQIIGRSAYTVSANIATPIVATNKMFAEQDNTLYRNSVGHHGVACQSCHGSTHAEWPTTQANDNLTATTIQGHDGKITECIVCHGSGQALTTNGGPHGLHNINSSTWVSGHESRASASACGTCHGTKGEGTVLSKAAATRTLAGHTIAKGTQIGCSNCHSNKL
jgi:hypothetical protein